MGLCESHDRYSLRNVTCKLRSNSSKNENKNPIYLTVKPYQQAINMSVIKMTDLALENQRVLIREDLNVPVDYPVLNPSF